MTTDPGGGGRARWRWVALFVVAGLALAGCSPDRPATDSVAAVPEVIEVASFDFPESQILAEIYAQALERAGLSAVHQPQVGPREIMEPALEQGLVDLVPEYLGSALAFLVPGIAVATLDTEAAHQRLQEVLVDRGLVVLDPSTAENQNGFVVTPDTAQRYGLQSVSDLRPIAGELRFGGPPECRERPFCLVGLQNTYGLSFLSFTALDSGGPLTRAALTGGEVDVALLFTTDGHVAAGDFVLLDDDRNLQPPENVAPVVREEVVERFGEQLVPALDRVSAALTTDGLAALNREVSLQGRPPAEVATAWLDANAGT